MPVPKCPSCTSTTFRFLPVEAVGGGQIVTVYCAECGTVVSAEIDRQADELPEVFYLVGIDETDRKLFQMRSHRPFIGFRMGEELMLDGLTPALEEFNGTRFKIAKVEHVLDLDPESNSHRIVLRLVTLPSKSPDLSKATAMVKGL